MIDSLVVKYQTIIKIESNLEDTRFLKVLVGHWLCEGLKEMACVGIWKLFDWLSLDFSLTVVE